jgi:DNA polymerase elongation subunit (family B)
LIVRGVEIRRHDTPKFIREFQIELLSVLFDCEDVKGIMNKGYESALMLVTKAIDKIMIGGDGGITKNDLVISKLLGQSLEKYRSLFPHVSAAIKLSEEDNYPSKGDTIRYIYTDSQHKNPLHRVMPVGSTHGSSMVETNPVFSYDKEKYREMLLDAAETVLDSQALCV